MGKLANRKPFPWGREDKNLLEFFRCIGSIRNKENFLEQAELNILDINKQYMMFERTSEDAEILVAVNRTHFESEISIPSKYEKCNKVYSLKKSSKRNLTPYGGVAVKRS